MAPPNRFKCLEKLQQEICAQIQDDWSSWSARVSMPRRSPWSRNTGAGMPQGKAPFGMAQAREQVRERNRETTAVGSASELKKVHAPEHQQQQEQQHQQQPQQHPLQQHQSLEEPRHDSAGPDVGAAEHSMSWNEMVASMQSSDEGD